MKPTVGSLFAGIGGFEFGFERQGFETVWQVEIDPFCRKVLAKHFPSAERFEDVRECGKHNLKPVDVICGGFPCQDISNAGLRAGIEGERSGLWSEYARIIGELRPRFVLVENVAALLGRGMGRVLGDLAALGYDAEWEIVSAADVGAPHLRERVWIIAYADIECFGRFDARDYEKGGKFQNKSCGVVQGLGSISLQTSDDREERIQGIISESLSEIGGFSWCKDVRRVEDLRGRSDIPEPLFRGASDGIPDWVHRVGSLGNSVVPQIPEMYARKIKELL